MRFLDLLLLTSSIEWVLIHGECSISEDVAVEDVPANLNEQALEKRHELIEMVSEVDDKLAEAFLSDEPISASDLQEVARKFVPVFMGSAFKNKDIQQAHAGQIVAVFGVDCASGDTFTDGSVKYTMTSMSVPEPVMSLAISSVSKDSGGNFSKALNRFQKEDPTFRVSLDPESSQTIISGMGELHLDIYVERMRREYKVDATVGKPRVNFREAITQRASFDYLHKKQSGGSGQYGRVIGYVEPLPADSGTKFEFDNMIVGQAIPPNFVPAIEKGFKEAVNSGSLIGHPVENIRIVLTDGAAHTVDSSELAFKMAAIYAFRQCYTAAKPVIMEPVMMVELKCPTEFQGTVTGDINKRKGLIVGNDQEGDDCVLSAHVPLNNMFGYSTALRSMTQGKGEFTMEYLQHSQVSQDVQTQLVNNYKASRGEA